MPTEEYAVATALSFAAFDDQRAALALLREVMVEVTRLQACDPRIVRSRMNLHRRHRSAEIVLGVRAIGDAEAFDLALATLRSSVHASGGSTAAWSALSAPDQVTAAAFGATWREASRRTRAVPVPSRRGPSWSNAAAIARRRSELVAPLPSIGEFAAPIILP